ncbi:MAG TPA: glycerophosphodiester phosphodiesterase family protein [Microlunatus sp.]|nr:glycerophosphodiester phosphodiesterase family protein [Microlunatus sp.]
MTRAIERSARARDRAATRVTGHRGARGLWPENSLEGFRQVTALDVDAVEFDVHRSDAGELLVLHDPLVERTTDGSGPVRRLTPDDRRRLRLRSSSETVPTLAEVLEVLTTSTADLHVEIKNDETGSPYPGLVAEVVAELDRRDLRARCHLASFDLAVLDDCRRLAPDIRRLVSVDAAWLDRQGGPHCFLERAEELADVVAVHHAVLDEHWQSFTGRLPLDRICVWTVNDEDEIRAWFERGVGHLTTDRPDVALQVRDGRPASPSDGWTAT